MSDIKKDFLQGRKANTNSPDLKIQVDGKTLTLNYQSKTWRSMFDISDINGRILKTGEITQNESKLVFNLSDFKAGNYSLWIVDGADLIKMNFILPN